MPDPTVAESCPAVCPTSCLQDELSCPLAVDSDGCDLGTQCIKQDLLAWHRSRVRTTASVCFICRKTVLEVGGCKRDVLEERALDALRAVQRVAETKLRLVGAAICEGK